MVRMQIQVPDELYAKTRAVADYREWTLAETIRRSLEVFVQMSPRADAPKKQWQLPPAHDFGQCRIPERQWREEANIGHVVEQLRHDRNL